VRCRCFEINVNPMILKLKGNLDIYSLKMYPHTENEAAIVKDIQNLELELKTRCRLPERVASAWPELILVCDDRGRGCTVAAGRHCN